MNYMIKTNPLWIADPEVHQIFGRTRCYYSSTDGYSRKEANGIFVRHQRSKDGALGYVFRNPIDGANWLWVISKKTRKPFALARVS